MAFHRDDVLGTVVGDRYRVEAVLGDAHAEGHVFRGRDAQAGTTVVVRCPAVPESLTGDDLTRALATFRNEADLLLRISESSNDVEQLLTSGVAERANEEHIPFTVFEWLAGQSLERHLEERRGQLGSIGEALVILEPAARALTIAHAMGVTHRDIRPANLWLADKGGRTTLKVAAFGLGTVVGGAPTAFAPEYAAPEHFKRTYGPISPATDVYGLALCIIELVTGRRALEGSDPTELYLATSDLGRRPTLRGRGSHGSDALESVLQRALAVDPKRRYQNVRELWEALALAVPEMTPPPPSVRPRNASDRPPGVTDASPASLPPGIAARPIGAFSSSSIPAYGGGLVSDDARLGDSVRSAAIRPLVPSAPKPAGDRTGLVAWIVVGVVSLLAIAIIAAKLGGCG